MGQVLHGSARTTEAVRRAIQKSEASVRALAERYGINPKTVVKWKKRGFVEDAPMGPKVVRSSVLSTEQEAMIVAFRKHTLLPLDDCLYALQATIPHLSRSALHRCLQRHSISHLPAMESDKPSKKTFKSYPVGFFHLDIAEVRTEEGKLYLFVAIDQTSKLAYTELHNKAISQRASAFLRSLIETVPYKIHTVLTDNGVQSCDLPKSHSVPSVLWRTHLFDGVCNANGIDHRLTPPNHSWTHGQVERMNRTLKEATVKRSDYHSHDQLRGRLETFMVSYNFTKRFKALRGLTPYEYVCKIWKNSQTYSGQIRPIILWDYTPRSRQEAGIDMIEHISEFDVRVHIAENSVE